LPSHATETTALPQTTSAPEPVLPDPIVPPSGRRLRPTPAHWLAFLSGLVAVGALAASAWVYSANQREVVRLATEVAQLRLSLDLYQQRAAGSAPADQSADLLDLSNRLAILEESWRTSTPAPATAALPPAADTSDAGGGDCLPTGTRFMVAAGDTYPVCNSTAVISIGAVDNGFISLADGTVVAQGGNIALPGTGCMLGVVPSDGGSLSGFAEIRVTC
jgi:hypothetical protein